MTSDEFAEALSRLVAEAEDAGLGMPAMIEALEEEAPPRREAWEE